MTRRRRTPASPATLVAWGCLGGLAYAYVGYPLLMKLWARVAPNPPRTGDATPSVTLLVPAHNEADVIVRKLENSLALDYPAAHLQVVLVDDGSDDGTAALAEPFVARGLRLLRQPQRAGKAAATARGMGEATGDIVVLSDASALLESDALRTAMRYFADPQVGVVSGRIRLFETGTAVERSAGLYWRYEERLRRWESASGTTVGVNGNFFAFRRELYPRLAPSTINDEFTIAMRIAARGHRVIYAPDVVAFDMASPTMLEERARRTRIGAGRYQALIGAGLLSARRPALSFRLASHKLSRAAAPFLLLGLAASSALALADRHRPSRSVLPITAGQATLYLLALGGWLGEHRRWGRRPWFSVPYYFVSGHWSMLAGLVRYCRGSQAVTWQKRPATTSPAASRAGGAGESPDRAAGDGRVGRPG